MRSLERCSTINFRFALFRVLASLLPYLLSSHCSVFKVQAPASFEARSQNPIRLDFEIRQQMLSSLGGPEWARTTDLTIISRTL